MRIFIATDPHYLAPHLFMHSNLFREMTGYGDGKQMEIVEEISDAFVAEVILQRPDALIITGDMAYKGEEDSHLLFSSKLKAICREGIPVYVMPGNHDIDDPSARDYSGDMLSPAATVSSKRFCNLYSFGIPKGEEKGSLSYTVTIEGFRLFLLDTCLYEQDRDLQPARAGGMVKPSTFKWLEKELENTRAKGLTPIVFSHHNLLEHNSVFYVGYTLSNAKELRALLERFDVKLYISGHMHIQSIGQTPSIHEIANGSLTVYPNLYGILTAAPGENTIHYQAKSVDVAAWAKREGRHDDELLHFPARSRKYFRNLNFWKCYSELSALSLPENLCTTMAEFFSMANTAYFSGRMPEHRDELLLLEGWELWRSKGVEIAPFTWAYLESMLAPKNPENQTALTLSI